MKRKTNVKEQWDTAAASLFGREQPTQLHMNFPNSQPYKTPPSIQTEGKGTTLDYNAVKATTQKLKNKTIELCIWGLFLIFLVLCHTISPTNN